MLRTLSGLLLADNKIGVVLAGESNPVIVVRRGDTRVGVLLADESNPVNVDWRFGNNDFKATLASVSRTTSVKRGRWTAPLNMNQGKTEIHIDQFI